MTPEREEFLRVAQWLADDDEALKRLVENRRLADAYERDRRLAKHTNGYQEALREVAEAARPYVDGASGESGRRLVAALERVDGLLWLSAASGDPVARETTVASPASEQTEVKP